MLDLRCLKLFLDFSVFFVGNVVLSIAPNLSEKHVEKVQKTLLKPSPKNGNSKSTHTQKRKQQGKQRMILENDNFAYLITLKLSQS